MYDSKKREIKLVFEKYFKENSHLLQEKLITPQDLSMNTSGLDDDTIEDIILTTNQAVSRLPPEYRNRKTALAVLARVKSQMITPDQDTIEQIAAQISGEMEEMA